MGWCDVAAKYSDKEIAQMIAERKPLPEDYRSRVQLHNKRGHKERELDIVGERNTEFRLILRQSNFNTLDFSIILAVSPPDSSKLFRLRRYNGKHGEHTNRIEGTTFYNFHIHQATERYQESGADEDTFAEPDGPLWRLPFGSTLHARRLWIRSTPEYPDIVLRGV